MERLSEIGSSSMNKIAFDVIRMLILIFWIILAVNMISDNIIAFIIISIPLIIAFIVLTMFKRNLKQYLVDKVSLDGDYLLIEREDIHEKIHMKEIVNFQINLKGGPGMSYYGLFSLNFNNTINFGKRIDFFAKRRFQKQVDTLLYEEINRVRNTTAKDNSAQKGGGGF